MQPNTSWLAWGFRDFLRCSDSGGLASKPVVFCDPDDRFWGWAAFSVAGAEPRGSAPNPQNAVFGRSRGVLLALVPVLVATQSAPGDAPISARAKQLHERAIVVDTHDDTTQRLVGDKTFNCEDIKGPRHMQADAEAMWKSCQSLAKK